MSQETAASNASRTVVVIGGGPAGATAAALLARANVDVLLIEREVFPRYHIGESLAASCRSIMDLSGVLSEVESCEFPVKRGALLRWGGEDDWTVDWAELFGPSVSSWQVDREVFDQVLLRNAAKQGAEVVEDAVVKRVVFDGDRAVAVEWARNDAPDSVRSTKFDYLIDASGRAGILTRQHFRSRRPHEIFRNVAIWGYWDGGERLSGTPEGGINVISAPDGWYWMIPLKGDRSSVGFVTHQDNFLGRRKAFSSPETMLHQLVEESETVRSLVANATYVPPTRVESDFSYVSTQFSGPGYFVVGDAACFLDPLLSTGVHLAMYSSMLASAGILSTMRQEVTEAQARAFFESLYHHAYSRLLTLVSGVYEQYRGTKSYFWLAQRLVRERSDLDRPNSAFGELTSGLSDLRDAYDAEGWRHQLADKDGTDPERPGLTAFRLRPEDLYDTATGLHLVTTPRLGLSPVTAG